MEIGNLWLIPVSLLFNSGLYLSLKHYLVKWFCRCFLSKSVLLECDLNKKQQTNGAVISNGTIIANGINHAKPSEKDLYGGRKLVTDGEIATVSMETVGSVIASITALVSILVMIETRHDIMYSRSSILIPWSHVAAWYFIVDLCNMYDAYRSRRNISHLPMAQRYYSYVRAKWSYVLHHVVLFSFGYLIVVNPSLRSNKGDFIVASIIGEDVSNPMVNTAKVLKLLGQEKTTFYMVNGLLLVIVFFIVRILNIPFDLAVYAAQYHNWDIFSAMLHLRLLCYVFIVLQYILQIYWFILILKVAIRGLTDMKKTNTSAEKTKVE